MSSESFARRKAFQQGKAIGRKEAVTEKHLAKTDAVQKAYIQGFAHALALVSSQEGSFFASCIASDADYSRGDFIDAGVDIEDLRAIFPMGNR